MARKFIFASIITSMIGSASILAINLGFMQLSPYRVCTLLLFFYTILIMEKNRKININKFSNNIYSIYFIFIWVIYAILTVLWVKDYMSWLRILFFLIFGLIVFINYSTYIKNTYDILKAFRFISIMVLFHNVIGWYEIITSNYLFVDTSKIYSYARANYPASIFGNPNSFATFMLLSIWVSYICLVNEKKRTIKILYISLIISSSWLILYSRSRANLLGLLLAVMVFILCSIKYKKTKHVSLFFICLLFIFILFSSNLLRSLTSSVAENLTFNFTFDSSEGTRLNLVKNGLLFLIKTFGFGVGAGNIEYWMKYKAIFNTNGVLNMHNWWLEILVSFGVIIFIMYLVFYLKLFISTYKKYKYTNNKLDKSLSLGIMCFMTGFILGSISSSSNIGSEWLWTFWGIVIAYQGINDCIISNDV